MTNNLCKSTIPIHWYGNFGYGMIVICDMPEGHEDDHSGPVDEEFKRLLPSGRYSWSEEYAKERWTKEWRAFEFEEDLDE